MLLSLPGSKRSYAQDIAVLLLSVLGIFVEQSIAVVPPTDNPAIMIVGDSISQVCNDKAYSLPRLSPRSPNVLILPTGPQRRFHMALPSLGVVQFE